MKIGVLFAGQGAQYSGMGKDLYDNNKKAKAIFEKAGEEIKTWCFEGTKEELRQTNITQPCVYTVTIAAFEAFKEAVEKAGLSEKITFDSLAGFSLGEYAALCAGNVFPSFEKGLEVVKLRGKWMNEAGKNSDGENIGGMIAAIGERSHILECVEAAREGGILEGVNYNSPIQTVVAGDKEALERFKIKAKEAGHIKAVPLSVGTAFHSPMMEPAVPKLFEELIKAELQEPTVKIYTNVTGKDIMTDADKEPSKWLAEVMANQTKSPVYWQETVENMIADGINVFVEIGPGNTLCGLVKKINHEAITMNVENIETLQTTLETLKTLV